MRRRARAFLLLALMSRAAPCFPCGGGEFYPIDAALYSTETLFSRIIAPESVLGGPQIPKELWFLYPFKLTKPDEIAELWRECYEGGASSPAVDGPDRLNSMMNILRDRAPIAAVGEARAIVDHVLDMPVGQANVNQEEVRRAVELVELQPYLKGVDRDLVTRFFSRDEAIESSAALPPELKEALEIRRMARADMGEYAKQHPASPRIASLRFVAVQEAMHHDIPDGWQFEIARAMTPDDWKRLEALHDSWLADFPDHPLADLVRLSKVRIYWYQGDARAWSTLFDLYPRHLPRLLAEMRYLKGGILPREFLNHPHVDPLLQTALLLDAGADQSMWSSLWKLSEARATEPWAINLQERLLKVAGDRVASWKSLPQGFPEKPSNPTRLWGRLRLVALYKAGRLDKFEEQDRTLGADADLAAFRARILLMHGEPLRAAQVEKLDPLARSYLVRVMLDEKSLVAAAQTPDAALRAEATLTRAVRRAAQGDWKGGADLLRDTDPEKAALWTEVAGKAADRSSRGRLAWARFLRDNDGKLLFGVDKVWDRSVCGRARVLALPEDPRNNVTLYERYNSPDLPWTKEEEITAIRRHLDGSSETFLALQAYAAWLSSVNLKDRDVGEALKEADTVYNRLINWPYVTESCFNDALKGSDAAATLRRVGRQIRGS